MGLEENATDKGNHQAGESNGERPYKCMHPQHVVLYSINQ